MKCGDYRSVREWLFLEFTKFRKSCVWCLDSIQTRFYSNVSAWVFPKLSFCKWTTSQSPAIVVVVRNMSPTSYCYHQLIASPTSVTNIDVTNYYYNWSFQIINLANKMSFIHVFPNCFLQKVFIKSPVSAATSISLK